MWCFPQALEDLLRNISTNVVNVEPWTVRLNNGTRVSVRSPGSYYTPALLAWPPPCDVAPRRPLAVALQSSVAAAHTPFCPSPRLSLSTPSFILTPTLLHPIPFPPPPHHPVLRPDLHPTPPHPTPPHPRLCRWWTGCGRRRRTTCRSALPQHPRGPTAAGGCWPMTVPWQGACCRWEGAAGGAHIIRTPLPPA